MTGALITALPMVILFLLTQRLFRQGLASSSLK
jgi:ABC-type maltose transport system permease subunit